jgi:hypothetical protein
MGGSDIERDFARLTKKAGKMKCRLKRLRDTYRGLVFYESNQSTACRQEIRKLMIIMMPLVVNISTLHVQSCPEMWAGRDAEVLIIMRKVYDISDNDLLTFDLVFTI